MDLENSRYEQRGVYRIRGVFPLRADFSRDPGGMFTHRSGCFQKLHPFDLGSNPGQREGNRRLGVRRMPQFG